MNITVVTTLVVVILFLVSGCATKVVNLVKERNIEIKKDDSFRGKLRNIKVLKKKDQVMITGLVVKKTKKRILKGHVHVDVYDENNEIRGSVDSDYRFRRTGLRKAKSARFQASLAVDEIQNARIVVTHHDARAINEQIRLKPDSSPANGGFLLIE